jgi:methionyl-tRNA formyltransferase
VGDRVKIVFLTTDDPIYLPAFFETVLTERGGETQQVFVVPPLYKGQTPSKAAGRYLRTFGLAAFVRLASRVVVAKVRGRSVESVCRQKEVPSSVAEDVNAEGFLDELRALEPDVIVSVSCPQIFKEPLIELPRLGILNIHGAILPQYRGVMPSFWMLANGEKRAGVSIYFVNEQIDAGDLCGQRVFDIHPDDSLERFLRRSKKIAAELLLEVLAKLEDGSVVRTPLDLSQGSYYSWPDKGAVERFRANGRRLW